MLSIVAGRSQQSLVGAATRKFGSALGRSLPAALTARLTLDVPDNNREGVRSLSSRSSSGGKHQKFSPRRRPAANYRPTKPRGDRHKNTKGNKGMTMAGGGENFHQFGDKIINLGDDTTPATGSEYDMYDDDGLASKYGVNIARGIRHMRREQDVHKGRKPTADDFLREMDYLTSAPGSTEDLVGERRALSFETESEDEKRRFHENVDKLIEDQRVQDLRLDAYEDPMKDDGKLGKVNIDMDDPFTSINPNQLAHGEWGEMVIRVDRNIKLWRGGRIQSYRALVIGGNLNGCAGFGTGKAPAAREAVLAASRKCKRNIFFVDRYQNSSLTRDLVGRSNSCKVVLRATNRGLRGNDLACEILKYFGITNATAKSVHGNRSQFNVVRATFKALMTHESMEEISLKRGKRIVSIDRGRKLQLY